LTLPATRNARTHPFKTSLYFFSFFLTLLYLTTSHSISLAQYFLC